MATLTSILGSGPSEQLEPTGTVWHLPPISLLTTRDDKADIGIMRLCLVKAIVQSGVQTFVRLPGGDPGMDAHLAEPDAWGLRMRDVPGCLEFLCNDHLEGDWLVWASDVPFAGPHPNAFHTPPEAIVTFVLQHDLDFLIESFHDDTEWIIGLHPRRHDLFIECGSGRST